MASSLRDRLARLHQSLFAFISRFQWLPGVLLRVTLGVVFLQSGWGKVHHLDRVTGFFTQLGIPAPHAQAVFVSGLELLGGTLLLLGLGTRFIAFPLAVTMVVALETAKKDEIQDWTDLFAQVEMLYLILFGVLIVQGAGAFSLDALLVRWLRRGRPAAEGSPPSHLQPGGVVPGTAR